MSDVVLDPKWFGWLPDFHTRPAVAASMPKLAQVGNQLTMDPSKTVLLYKVYKQVWADYPSYPAQTIGDCESMGHGHANDLLQTIEVYTKDLPITAVHQTDTEALYAMGREVGGMLGNQDGCYGSAMVKSMTTMGTVSRYEINQLSAGEGTYSGTRAKEWGRTGAPDAVKTLAATHKLGSAAAVTTTDEAIAALQNGHPFTISTRQGFTLVRDSDGFCRPKGTWGHCMFVSAYRADKPGFLIHQSWGPNMPSGPLALDQPDWTFWCDVNTMASILAENDSWALSGSPGFLPKSLPGFMSKL